MHDHSHLNTHHPYTEEGEYDEPWDIRAAALLQRFPIPFSLPRHKYQLMRWEMTQLNPGFLLLLLTLSPCCCCCSKTLHTSVVIVVIELLPPLPSSDAVPNPQTRSESRCLLTLEITSCRSSVTYLRAATTAHRGWPADDTTSAEPNFHLGLNFFTLSAYFTSPAGRNTRKVADKHLK